MDETLRQLIRQVCQHPQRSLQRRLLMNRLLFMLQQLPGIGQSSHPDYLDALNRTWEWVNRSLCEKFDPSLPNLQKRLAQWIDSYLYWRIRELYAASSKISKSTDFHQQECSLSLINSLPDGGDFAFTRSGLDSYIERLELQQTQTIGEQLERYIYSDRDHRLKSLHPKDYPQCNCQFLSQRLLLQYPPAKYTQLARELGVNPQTLISHWKRKCLPLLQEIAQELGYKRDF